MLFFLLIGACLSIKQGSLNPILPNGPASNMISIAKTNPRVLVELLDGADPDTINNIVKILQSLIQDLINESSRLSDDIKNATRKVHTIEDKVKNLQELEGTAEATYRRLVEVEEEKKGKHQALSEAFEDAEPGLSKEIETLEKVLEMLQKLLDQNQPEEKELLELGSSERGKAYLKLIANVQANPEKLSKVIGFIGTLKAKAMSNLDALAEKVRIAKEDHKQATDERVKSDGLWQVAKKALEDGKDELAVAKGMLSAAVELEKKRTPTIERERLTLVDVIRLLKSTADKPTFVPTTPKPTFVPTTPRPTFVPTDN